MEKHSRNVFYYDDYIFPVIIVTTIMTKKLNTYCCSRKVENGQEMLFQIFIVVDNLIHDKLFVTAQTNVNYGRICLFIAPAYLESASL